MLLAEAPLAKRRKIHGTPLLVASAGIGISLACGGSGGGRMGPPPPPGNLMPPPDSEMVSVCVDVLPADAVVRVDGVEEPSRCGERRAGRTVLVEVSAPGHQTHTESVSLTESRELVIRLDPE
ncbi:MAG: hypothetical protein EP330_14885 [Deltaproteobacteria bacterium]|nr:MAG: hypothetical protein EP330_14885 [Deltaproteobacteria bacterium]